MHEFSIIENILTIVEEISEKEGLTSVSKVTLLIGKMRQIVPDTMSFAFEAAAKGTIADSAALEMEFVPIKIHCNECGNEFIVKNHTYVCEQCGSTDLSVLEGQELIIKNIEGER